jgi:hypothetical protein
MADIQHALYAAGTCRLFTRFVAPRVPAKAALMADGACRRTLANLPLSGVRCFLPEKLDQGSRGDGAVKRRALACPLSTEAAFP